MNTEIIQALMREEDEFAKQNLPSLVDFIRNEMHEMDDEEERLTPRADLLFKYDKFSHGIGTSEEQTHTIEQLISKIEDLPHYYEVLKGEVVPYFDFDLKMNNAEDLEKNHLHITRSIRLALKDLFGASAKIHLAISHGLAVKNNTKYNKYSLHAVIRGVGKYACGEDVKITYVEKLNKLIEKHINNRIINKPLAIGDCVNNRIINKPLAIGDCVNNTFVVKCDPAVYKGQGLQQLMRTICSCKREEGTNRIMIPIDEDNEPIEYFSNGDALVPLFEKYLISVVDDERLHYVKKSKPTAPSKPSKKTHAKAAEQSEAVWIIDIDQEDDDIIDELNEKFHEYHPSAGLCKQVGSSVDDYIILQFANSTLDDCLICERQHSSNNCYITYHPAQRVAYYKCHSARDDQQEQRIKVFGKALPEVKAIKPVMNSFNPKDPYCFNNFSTQYANKTFDSYQQLIDSVGNNVYKVLACVLQGEGLYVKKDNCTDRIHTIIKKITTCNFDMFYKTKEDKETITKMTLLDYIKRHVQTFSTIVVQPVEKDVKQDEFNIWSGFAATYNTDLSEKHDDAVQLLKDFIYEVWADSDQARYKYIISWLVNLVKDLGNIAGVALVLVSKPGTGKTTLSEFLKKYVLGGDKVVVEAGISGLVQEHNRSLEAKRLVVVNEMASTRDEFLSNFDKLKSLITDATIRIEPKGIDPYQVMNTANFIMCTNHVDSLHIEEHDRRYAVFGVSEVHMQDEKYFANLRAKCFNQSVVDAFYTWLMTIPDDDLISVRSIPESPYRKEMIELSKPNPKKFLDRIIEDRDDKEMDAIDKLCPDLMISGVLLYDAYRKWCVENGERPYTNTKFAMSLKNSIEKRKSNGVMMYDITTAK